MIRVPVYARQIFVAHTKHVPADKLRFLQRITAESADWWKEQHDKGAVLIGAEAKNSISPPLANLPPGAFDALEEADIKFRAER